MTGGAWWDEQADKLASASATSPEEAMDMLQRFMRTQSHAPMTRDQDWNPSMPRREIEPTCYRCGLSVRAGIHELA